MINIYIVLGILFCHWMFDFVFQTDDEARGKSTSFLWLISHTYKYSAAWFIPICFFGGYIGASPKILLFLPITFYFHTLTDYFTSKLNKKLWDNNQVHYFFVSIGFDQFLHFMQLLLTFYYLSK